MRSHSAEHVGLIVPSLEHEGVIEIELLRLGVRWDVVRVGHFEHAPFLPAFGWSGPGILMVFGFRSARSDMAYSFYLASGVPAKSNVMDVMRPGTARCAAQTAREIDPATRDWSRGR